MSFGQTNRVCLSQQGRRMFNRLVFRLIRQAGRLASQPCPTSLWGPARSDWANMAIAVSNRLRVVHRRIFRKLQIDLAKSCSELLMEQQMAIQH